MIIKEEINGLIFQEQRTYRIYKSEEDMKNGNVTLTCSEEELFLANKEQARSKAAEGNKDNKFIVM